MQLRNDQPTNIRVLHELFREDCDVFMASGEQAITVCRTQLPDLILLDVVMEGMKYAVDSSLTLRHRASHHLHYRTATGVR